MSCLILLPPQNPPMMQLLAAGRSRQSCSSSVHGVLMHLAFIDLLQLHGALFMLSEAESLPQHTCLDLDSMLAGVHALVHGCRRQISRDQATNVARAMSNVSSAIIFGGIFWRMGRSQTSIQDRMGLMQVIPCPQQP